MQSFLSSIAPRLCLTAFTFSQPFLLSSTVSLIGQQDPSRAYGHGLIGACALIYIGIAVGVSSIVLQELAENHFQVSNSIFQYQSFRSVTRLRGGLTALVYQQTLQIRSHEQEKVTAMGILGADIPQIVAGFQFVHEVWASLLNVGIATYLLQRKLSLACLAPVLLVLVFLAITSKIAPTAGTRQRRWIEKIQERLKATSDSLESLKAIKMLGLTQTVTNLIQKLRKEEIKSSTSYRKALLRVILLCK